MALQNKTLQSNLKPQMTTPEALSPGPALSQPNDVAMLQQPCAVKEIPVSRKEVTNCSRDGVWNISYSVKLTLKESIGVFSAAGTSRLYGISTLDVQ